MLNRWMLLAFLTAGGAALAVLAVWPQLDLAVSALGFDPASRHFPAAAEPGLRALRTVFRTLPHLIFWPVLAVLAAAWLRPALRPKVPVRALAFLVLTFALGPGLLVNGIAKGGFDRPRPHETTAFGGTAEFRPWWRPGPGWFGKASFASGEAASAAWTVAPAALVPPPWRGVALGVAAAYTLAASALRVAFGAHFLSDVLAGALCALAMIWLGARWVGRRTITTPTRGRLSLFLCAWARERAGEEPSDPSSSPPACR